MLRFAVVGLVAFVVCVLASEKQSLALEKIQGTGVFRESESACLESLPQFTKRLREIGLRVDASAVECQEVGGEPDAFEPTFEAASDHAALIETAQGIPTDSRSSCEKNLEGLRSIVADSDETIIESACVELHAETTDGEDTTKAYQPMLVLLKTTRYVSAN